MYMYVLLFEHVCALQDLNVGVRRLRVSVNDEVVFDDELEKGCGNQVFDYHKTIRIHDASATSDSSADSAKAPHSKKPTATKSLPSTSKAAAPQASHKSVNDVILPLELLNQPSEYDSATRKSNSKSSAGVSLTPSSSSSSLSRKTSKTRSDRSASRGRHESNSVQNDSESSPEHASSSRATPKRVKSRNSQDAFDAPTGIY